MAQVKVIGGGLAGSEAAWQLASRGIDVLLYEMRPEVGTGAHVTGDLAELVCSNSLGSNLPDRASGLLKEESRRMGSLLIEIADKVKVPAGGALAVDREQFAKQITARLESHPNVKIIREEYKEIPDGPTIIASGPLTSSALADQIIRLSGEENLYFFDAISPIIEVESISFDIAFRGSRYQRGEQEEGDYINCPMNQEEYEKFLHELINAERIKLKDFELALETGVKAGAHHYFEGCLPVEIIGQRSELGLAYGPMRPVGLRDPRTEKRSYAVLQLRQDNLAGSIYNMVGFQTNLTFPEQRRVFRLIPGLEKAIFYRYGQMHRNTFIFAPKLLHPTLQWRERSNLFFAGQITGIEGYAGNIASGLLAGINMARMIEGKESIVMPLDTMLGSLCHYITHANEKDFQPMKANFGIIPPLGSTKKLKKRDRYTAYSVRALNALDEIIDKIQ